MNWKDCLGAIGAIFAGSGGNVLALTWLETEMWLGQLDRINRDGGEGDNA